MNVKRRLPINFSKDDFHLFEHEIERPLEESEIKYIKLTRIDSGSLELNLMPIKSILSGSFITMPRAVWVTDKWSNNYFHWITEISQKLELLRLNHLKSVPVLLPSELLNYQFIKDYIKLNQDFNFKIVYNSKRYLILNLIRPTLNVPTGNYHPKLLQNGLDLITINDDSFAIKSRLFLIRRFSRKILNIDEIEPILERYNVQKYFPEDHTLEEQIHAFRNCEFLGGVHGAGLTNMVWMKNESKVLELRKAGDHRNNCYFSLASVYNHDYYYQNCEVDDLKRTTQDSHFIVDPVLFEENLKIILS